MKPLKNQGIVDSATAEELWNLTESQRKVLALMYGYGIKRRITITKVKDGHTYTVPEIARIYRVTTGRIRSLERKAISTILKNRRQP